LSADRSPGNGNHFSENESDTILQWHPLVAFAIVGTHWIDDPVMTPGGLDNRYWRRTVDTHHRAWPDITLNIRIDTPNIQGCWIILIDRRR
jgi:hypothetical protein